MTVMDNEITGPVSLCDATGRLNPAAAGWARHPHLVCNLRGRFPRKKRWDYWCFVGPEQLISITLANIDYLGLGGAYVLDYATKRMGDCGAGRPFAREPRMPETTAGDCAIRFGATQITQHMTARGGVLTVTSPRCSGRPLHAEIHVEIPPGHETLNVVVPWSERNFQFTSKQVPLPCEGEVRWGGEVWRFDRETCFGVRDFGRGIWPYATRWNWAALSARNGGDTYGINLGGQWTDGTGATENGLILNGVLYPIAERVVFECDHRDYMKPWRLRTPDSETVALVLTPFYDRVTSLNLGFLKTVVHQCFGHFNGVIRTGGQMVKISDALGWAEEQDARW